MTDDEKFFPILGLKDAEWRGIALPVSVPWRLVESHRQQASVNHGQSLEQLAERGGLSPRELLAVLLDVPLRMLFAPEPSTIARDLEEVLSRWKADT